MSASETLLSIRDLSIAFGRGAREFSGCRSRIVRHRQRGDRRACRGIRIRQIGHRPVRDEVAALSGGAPSVGLDHVQGRDLLPLSERDMRHVRGNDITIIFQEPMTSLNPLHTIEKQIGEILLVTPRPCRPSGKSARFSSCSIRSAFRIRQDAASKLSAPALRRATSTRDDRDGARE